MFDIEILLRDCIMCFLFIKIYKSWIKIYKILETDHISNLSNFSMFAFSIDSSFFK